MKYKNKYNLPAPALVSVMENDPYKFDGDVSTTSLILPPRIGGGFGDALYIYRFEIMILVHVKAKSLLCYWAVRDLGIGMAQIARRLN